MSRRAGRAPRPCRDGAAVRRVEAPVAGRPVRGRSLGGGEAAVLLAGFGLSGDYLLPLARCLARTFRVLVPELPASGRSPSPRAPAPMVGLTLRDHLRTGPRRLLGEARVCIGYPLERRFPLVEAPRLVVRGARDPVAPQRWPRAAVHRAARAGGSALPAG